MRDSGRSSTSIVDGYFNITDRVDERLDDIEEIVFGGHRNDEIPQEVFTLRRSLVQFRRAAAPLREVIGELLRREVDWLGPEVDHRCCRTSTTTPSGSRTSSSHSETCSRACSRHTSRSSSNRMNDVMKKTSSYGAILLVSTLIAGIYGMNFKYMPELKLHFGYFFALGSMAIATILLWTRFKRKGWL